MRDINLINSELIELLDDLAADVGDMIKNYPDELMKALERKIHINKPETRAAQGKSDKYKCIPHMDILPEWCTDVQDRYDPVGREYLDYMLDISENKSYKYDQSEICGYPNKEIFLGLTDILAIQAFKDKYKLDKKADKITYEWLTGNSRALFGLYPPGGYIPWHNNGNAPGYNILMHYSWGGDGSFYSLHDGEIIEYKDKDRQWLARAGQFLDTSGAGMIGDATETVSQRDASWHAASTKCWRLTVSTIINHREAWEDVVDEMESIDF